MSSYLVIDLTQVRDNYCALRSALPTARIRFAVKAAPISEVIRLLADEGAEFDVAGVGEIEQCLGLGIDPAAMCYGNPIKKASHIATAYAAGVRRYVFDTEDELNRIAVHAPGAEVECRFLASVPRARVAFGAKFGCAPGEVARMLVRARDLGLRVVGPCFHVGSQQLDPAAWRIGIEQAGGIAEILASEGITVSTVNIGGGLPISYADPAPAPAVVGAVIATAAGRYLPDGVDLVVEPGRALAGSAGVIHTEVVAVRTAPNGRRWVYLDIGRYSGLIDTDYIDYRIETDRDGDPADEAVLAGPTCRQTDVLHRCRPVLLPITLRAGDSVRIRDTGAYTASFSSVFFNGFPPLAVRVVGA
ncbi:type III PLP-dependent enzyme [Nocardia paucivorans]|uniref:type III PLP-dependent enzyme n=1 Tax=Nocardia paucivorans TaxID=114259 RepID=UPI0005948B6F|nr:type III PLP-dependent enzyme [Nocardia paucivorans]